MQKRFIVTLNHFIIINSFLLKRLGFSSLDGKLAIYNIFSKEECLQIADAHKREIINLFFYEKQFQIITICIDNSISIWDYRNLSKIEFIQAVTINDHCPKPIKCGFFIKNKEILLVLKQKLQV